MTIPDVVRKIEKAAICGRLDCCFELVLFPQQTKHYSALLCVATFTPRIHVDLTLTLGRPAKQ